MTETAATLPRQSRTLRKRLARVASIVRWHHLALVGVLFVAALLRFYQLDREEFGNLYYAATVRSMLTSWHNFFFASYDAGGFVTVDKPPLGFWIQAASAALLGYSGLSLLLPQAIAGVLSVGVLYRLVQRIHGVAAGLIAAAVLAVMPITVATDRNNTPDGLLVLLLVLAVWAVFVAVERREVRWLFVAAVLIGLGFNVKMLQAYLVVPAVWLFYLVAAKPRLRTRVAHLAAATAVLVAVSFSWAIAVDLTPADRRPYVGGSGTNSVVDLALGYNGLQRLLGLGGGAGGGLVAARATGTSPGGGSGAGASGYGSPQMLPSGPGATGVASISGETGPPGPLRLFGPELAAQVSWLLPLALIGFVIAVIPVRRRRHSLRAALVTLNAQRGSALLWGTWLFTGATFFSVAGFWHRYYLVTMAPAIAALVGIGVVTMWRRYAARGAVGWALPAALFVAAIAQIVFLRAYPDFAGLALVAIPVAAAAATLVAVRFRAKRSRRPTALRLGAAATTAALVALLVAPGTWSAVTAVNAPGDMLPVAGPRTLEGFVDSAAAGPQGAARPGATVPRGARAIGLGSDRVDEGLIAYLVANRGSARFLVGTTDSSMASPIIIRTGLPVMAWGGFGADRILGTADLARLVREGAVRYFLLQSAEHLVPPTPTGPEVGQAPGQHPGGAPPADTTTFEPGGDLSQWVREHCRNVPESAWRSSAAGDQPPAGSGSGDAFAPVVELWDCATAR